MTIKRLQNTLLFLGLFLCVALPLQHLSAQSNTFTVGTYIDDSVPPTIPTPVDILPISTDQIDLTWGPSTDDWELSGYHVWRDGILVATTTALSYSDTGLTASTTYSYYITAFDTLNNDSASSTVVSTTTYAIPPAPSPFNAVPFSSSQINLAWGNPATNWVFAGYHVWRDGVQIATTTNTIYADTGLSASTTYSYYITAFDVFSNESASSTVVATSTYAGPLTEVGQGTRVRWFQNEPASISIVPNRESAEIQYTTNDYTQAVIKWGKTSSYELGSLVESVFLKEHQTILTDLEPDTKYYFTIEGFNRYSKYGEIYTGTFTTLPPIDTFPPHNVTNLTAVRAGDDIVLTWTNPVNDDFDKVRVVSNELFYPNDIADGWALYEGGGERALDRNVPWEDSWKYYTVFTYDELGNISSGAVVRVYLGESVFGAPEEDIEEIDPEKNNIGLTFGDIMFIQDGEVLEIGNNWSVNIDGGKELRIEVPYDKVPEHLKTILVVLTEKYDASKVFKFLLRINSEKTAYTGTIAPLGQSGVYPVGISVFDFKTAQIGYAGGILISNILSSSHVDIESQSLALKIIRTLFGSHLLWGIIALIALLYLSRRLLRAEW